MSNHVVASPANGLQRALCLVVFLVIALAILYAGWIGILNFSRIRV